MYVSRFCRAAESYSHFRTDMRYERQELLENVDVATTGSKAAERSKSASIVIPLWTMFGGEMMFGFLLKLCHSALTFASPLMLK